MTLDPNVIKLSYVDRGWFRLRVPLRVQPRLPPAAVLRRPLPFLDRVRLQPRGPRAPDQHRLQVRQHRQHEGVQDKGGHSR